MTTISLGKFLAKYIKPMFTGVEITEHEEKPRAWMKRRAFLRNQCEMYVRAAINSNKYFKLRRSQAFEKEDAVFVEYFVEKLHELATLQVSEDFIEDSINSILRHSVAKRIAPRTIELLLKDNVVCEKPLPDTSALLAKIFAQFEAWAERTYEGRKIAAAVGVNATQTTQNDVELLEVFKSTFGAVLANGLETFLTGDANGRVAGHEPLSNAPVKMNLQAPLRFSRLAEWSKTGRVGVGLTRNGEILVFADEALIFAKRRGIWHHFTNDAILKRLALINSFGPSICEAVYQTCLDVSFTRTGGGIALIKRTAKQNLISAQIIKDSDFVGSETTKGKCLKAIVNRPFHELDRHLRQDIVAMDGATVLDYHGNVIAAGAIVKVDAGSDGGGRLSAVRTLGRYGLAIKISSDGEISGFKGTDDGMGAEPHFTVG